METIFYSDNFDRLKNLYENCKIINSNEIKIENNIGLLLTSEKVDIKYNLKNVSEISRDCYNSFKDVIKNNKIKINDDSVTKLYNGRYYPEVINKTLINTSKYNEYKDINSYVFNIQFIKRINQINDMKLDNYIKEYKYI